MKAAFIYFSGTNNTTFLTNLLIKKLKENFVNFEYESLRVTNQTGAINLDKFDYIFLGYPIYGFNTPSFFLKYIKKLKINKNQKIIIYKQSGECMKINNASSRKILRRFKRNEIGEYHFLLPYNIHFKFDDNFISQLLYYDKLLLDILIEDIKNNNLKPIKSTLINNFLAFFVSIQSIGGPINSFFYKVDNKKCIKCKKCIEVCPNQNITLNKNNKITFHHHCLMCMACSFYCPKDAIKIGFLNNWRVNGEYNFKINSPSFINTNYIKGGERGFYKCYYPYFKQIEERHKKIK